MHLIIDGYNLLGARGEMRANAEPARERLLQDLMDYRLHKGHPITEAVCRLFIQEKDKPPIK